MLDNGLFMRVQTGRARNVELLAQLQTEKVAQRNWDKKKKQSGRLLGLVPEGLSHWG